MVFCSCRKTTTTSIENTTTATTPTTKKRFHLFHRKQTPVAYIATELDDDEIAPTPAELKRLKSVKRSKAHVDGVLYRNRNSGRKTLLTGDGVVNFAGFIDWMKRKRLREKMENGERYDRDEDAKQHNGGGGGEGATTMIVRVQKIDPVKSGFMGKKTDRDEITGCAAGTMVAAQWAGRRPPSRPELLVTPRKGAVNMGCTTTGCGADDSFATAATGCSPMSTGSVSFQEDNSPVHGNAKRLEGRDDLEEDAWCGAFNSPVLTEELTDSESIKDYSRSAPTADEESVWCDVFNSTTIVTEGEGEGEVMNEEEEDDDSEGEAENSSSAKIRGIQNVEVIYSEKQSMMKRVSTWKKKEDSFDQLQ